jgi:hypothetical protein
MRGVRGRRAIYGIRCCGLSPKEATSPDPTTSIIRRSAASNYAYVTVAVPPAPGENPNLTDQGNGERLAKRYGDEIRHCPELAPKEGLGS